jgi:hypothetical protein
MLIWSRNSRFKVPLRQIANADARGCYDSAFSITHEPDKSLSRVAGRRSAVCRSRRKRLDHGASLRHTDARGQTRQRNRSAWSVVRVRDRPNESSVQVSNGSRST